MAGAKKKEKKIKRIMEDIMKLPNLEIRYPLGE